MPVVTIQDYSTYRNPSHPYSRLCPNFRTCWPGLSVSYNPFVTQRALMLRRLAFLAIQALQIAFLILSVQRLYLLQHTLRLPVSPMELPGLLASILFFFFVAWNLHLIVRMEGSRAVWGKTFERKWFDGFLFGLAGAYGSLLARRLVKGPEVDRSVGTWCVLLDLLIFGVAWVSTWAPDSVVPVYEEV